MAPAFSSVRQAGLFALFLLATLASPLFIGKSALPSREQVYASIPWNTGNFAFIHREIFERKGDVDVLFIGSSHIYYDIDTPYVQRKLSEKLGRPAVVLSFCYRWPGLDLLYVIAKDLLEHRRVHTIVFYDDGGGNEPHVHSWQLIRFADNWGDLLGLPLRSRIAYYYGAILGMPRNLLTVVDPDSSFYLKPDLIQFLQWKQVSGAQAKLPTDNLGAEADRKSFEGGAGPFIPFTPPIKAEQTKVITFSGGTKDQFEFVGSAPQPLQSYFAKKLVALARANGTKLVCLYTPVLDERNSLKIPEGRLWPDTLRGHAELLGISPQDLFAGMDDSAVHLLYGDPVHMNENGEHFFTRVITPELIRIYEAPAN